jgi:toxic protein SymE
LQILSNQKLRPANKRKLTVSYASRHPDYNPALTLKGQWLEAAGFATGTEGRQK